MFASIGERNKNAIEPRRRPRFPALQFQPTGVNPLDRRLRFSNESYSELLECILLERILYLTSYSNRKLLPFIIFSREVH